MQKRTIKIGYKVICSESGVVGTVIRFYTPTSCEEQTMVKTKDGRQYHAPTRTWRIYTDGYKIDTMIMDEPIVVNGLLNNHGRYVVAFSTNYGITISEALGRKAIKTHMGVV
jgi:hypothetical protein